MLDELDHQNPDPAESAAPAPTPAAPHPTIDEIGERQCRWPVGTDGDGRHVFCAAPVEWRTNGAASGSYCAEHARLAGGLYSSLKPVLPCQAMSSVGSGPFEI